MTENTISYLSVSGSPKEIGYKIGKAFKTKINNFLDEFFDFQKHKAVYPNKRYLVQKMLKISKKLCPDVINEIEGLSEGSGWDFMDIFLHSCMHMPHWANCSTSVFKYTDTLHIAHNEDAHPLLEEYSYFVFVTPEKENSIPFFSHCYPGIVPGMSYGFNLAGIVQTCNSLPDPIKSVGLPRMFVGRTIYESARSIKDAVELINKLTPRSGGASYTIASLPEQDIINIETTGTDYAVIKIFDTFFRANHYISGKFKKHPAASRHTTTRQKRGDLLIPNIDHPEQLLDVMWDDSIYLTMDSTHNDCQTNATVSIGITKEEIVLKKYSNFPAKDYTVMRLSNLNKG